MSISIITAFDQNQLIGNNNELPWSIPEDLQYFKSKTVGKTVVMGRKTFESIGKPLPNRHNIVISSTLPPTTGIELFESPTMLSEHQDIIVIGGHSIYQHFLPIASTLLITEIDAEFTGNVFFPAIDYSQWNLIECSPKRQSSNGLEFQFKEYARL